MMTPRPAVVAVSRIAAILALLAASTGRSEVLTIDPSPACGDPGVAVQVTGTHWAPPAVPSEYVLYFDAVEVAQQGPLVPLEQPNIPFTVPVATASGDHVMALALRQTSDNAILSFVETRFVLPCPASVEAPRPQLVGPDRRIRHRLANDALLLAIERNRRLPESDVRVATFEYSNDGASWTPISVEYDPLAEKALPLAPRPNDWNAIWDTAAVPPGRYLVRVVMETFGGRRGEHRLRVEVRPPPVAVIAIAPGTGAGTVVFDASNSVGDWPKGCCRRANWDFGDGTSATGTVVTHTYADTSQTYDVTLKITTHFATVATAHDTLAFPGGTPVLGGASPECRCVGIGVQVAGKVLGSDGDAGVSPPDWPAYRNVVSGTRRGRVTGDTGNSPTAGEPLSMGWAFEVVALTVGSPSNCREIQLARATFDHGGGVFAYAPFVGTTKDLDLDGAVDIDVSTPEKCLAANGAWSGPPGNRCRLGLPKAGPKYAPDNYEAVSSYKAHPDNTIVWFDAPSTSNLGMAADFIALVRGTDGLYCSATYSVTATRAPDSTITEGIALGDTQVGVPKAELPATGW